MNGLNDVVILPEIFETVVAKLQKVASKLGKVTVTLQISLIL